jgi:hypothetical protein
VYNAREIVWALRGPDDRTNQNMPKASESASSRALAMWLAA